MGKALGGLLSIWSCLPSRPRRSEPAVLVVIDGSCPACAGRISCHKLAAVGLPLRVLRALRGLPSKQTREANPQHDQVYPHGCQACVSSTSSSHEQAAVGLPLRALTALGGPPSKR